MGLVVKSSRQIGPTDLEIVAADPQPITGSTYLVHGIHAGGQNIVDRGRVLTLASAVKGEQAAKGILITTGYFAEDAALPPEGAPIELINRARLTDLIREHGIVL